MQLIQYLWCPQRPAIEQTFGTKLNHEDLVLVYGDETLLGEPQFRQSLVERFPDAIIVGSTSSGEVAGDQLYEGSAVITVMELEHSRVRAARVGLDVDASPKEVGEALRAQLDASDLSYIHLLYSGDASGVADFITGVAKDTFPVGGALAGVVGDGKKRMVMDNHGTYENTVIAVGFYGHRLKVGTDVTSGWQGEGRKFEITKGEEDTIHEIDGLPALEVYRDFVGEEAEALPASGIHYPFQLLNENGDPSGFRTPIAIDEDAQSIRCSGDVAAGPAECLVYPGAEPLIEEVAKTGTACRFEKKKGDVLSLVRSNTTRKTLLGPLAGMEAEALATALGEGVCQMGIYGDGEIATGAFFSDSLAITTLAEV